MRSERATVIKSMSNPFYTEILWKVKGNPTISDLGDNLTRFRRTQKQ